MNGKSKRFILAAILASLFFMSYRLVVGTLVPGRPEVTRKPAVYNGPADAGGPATYGQPQDGRELVNVPASVLWSGPGPFREYDDLILREKNDMAAWAGSMDVSMRLWLVDKAETTVLFGEPVIVLDRRGDWLKVVAVEQKTILNESGYPGWLPAAHVVSNDIFLRELKNLPNIVVAKGVASLYSNAELTDVMQELSYMTRLPLLEEKVQAMAVRLPGGGTGYLASGDAKKTDELAFSRDGIVAEARRFLGLRYIWAGASSYGFDCSGFTMRLYQSQGILIPRDADDQAREGVAVARQDLLPGDLLFYAAKGGQGQIHHVGMYAGGGMMIHSPGSSSSVRMDSFDNGSYVEEYWGARRYAR